jgi:hypothetical protein
MTGNMVVIMPETCYEMGRIYEGYLYPIIMKPSAESRAMPLFQNLIVWHCIFRCHCYVKVKSFVQNGIYIYLKMIWFIHQNIEVL